MKRSEFIISVLIYIIFYFLYYSLISILSVVYLKLEVTNLVLYLLGGLVASILAIFFVEWIFRIFTKERIKLSSIFLKVFLPMLILFGLINKYVGILCAQQENNQMSYIEMFSWNQTMFYSATILLLIFFILRNRRKLDIKERVYEKDHVE